MSTSNILLIVNQSNFNFENANSAVANYLKMLRDALVASGYNVDLYPQSHISSVNPKVEGNKNGHTLFELFKLGLKKVIPKFYYSTVLFQIIYKQRKIQSYSNKKKYKMIIEFYTIGSVAGLELKKKFDCQFFLIYDCPVLLQFREMYNSKTFFDKLILNSEKKSIEAADCILCYSQTVKKHIQSDFQTKNVFFEMPCIVWKGGVSKIKKDNDEIIIGFIGSFLIWHKVPLLLNVFECLAKKYPFLRLHLIGYGEEWNKVKQMFDESEFKNRIYMPGYVSESELIVQKSKFDIAVMPGSNWYGSPLKLFEYAESEIPMIAPSTPVVLDLFKDGETALFIDATNEFNSLAEKIELLISNKNIANDLSHNAKKIMNNEYSREYQMKIFAKLVEKLIKDGI